MSRSGYTEDNDDQWQFIRWRGAVASAIRGRRGQAFLQEMRAALDALPEKKLIAGEIETEEGAVCAIGAVGLRRGLNMDDLDPYDRESVAARFNVPHALACEIFWENDEVGPNRETAEHRFERVRKWIESNIRKPPALWFWGTP